MIGKALRRIRKVTVLLLTICFFVSQILVVTPTLAAPSAASPGRPGTARLAGDDRYQTAVAIAQKGWERADCVVIARGDLFPDALSAGPLAFANDAPILLTPSDKLNEDTRAELKRLGAKKAMIIGGESAISAATAAAIMDLGIDVDRLAGNDRYATAVAVAGRLNPTGGVILVTGKNFPDALAISVVAAKLGMPILLTEQDALPTSVDAYLKEYDISKTYLIGGAGVISAAVEKTLPNPVRLAGANRYATNTAILKHFASQLDFSKIYLTSGTNFPDALTGAVLAAQGFFPLVLVGQTLASSTADYLQTRLKLDSKVYGLGGRQALPSSILASLIDSKVKIPVSKHYRKAGTYGPASGTATVAGDVMISSRDVTLRNTVIEGNLLLASTIGDGDVELNNVTVKGKMIINGGGPNSIILINFSGQTVVVDLPEGTSVRFVAQGTTSVADLFMESDGKLEETDLTGSGFINVSIPDSAEIVLKGNFEKVNVQGPGAVINVESGAIATLEIAKSAAGASVNLAAAASVTTLNVAAAATIGGEGQITNAQINTNGVVIKQRPRQITFAEGVTEANIGGEVITEPPGSAPEEPGDTGGPTWVGVRVISVTGEAKVGETLEAVADGQPNLTATYKWYKSKTDDKDGDYEAIEGATNKTYTPTEDDIGKYIKVEVKGTENYTGTRTSDAVGPVEEADEEEVSPVTYEVTFEITDEDEEAVEGATVVVKDSNEQEMTAEADGSYKLETGTYTYTVTAEGYEDAGDEFTVEGKDMTVEITLVKEEEVTVASVEELDGLEVDYGTAFAELELPETVEVILSDGETAEVDVTWAEGDYDGEAAATYTLVGTLDVSGEDFTNPSDVKAEIKVTVKEEEEEVAVFNSIQNKGYYTIQDAIAEAQAGDIILVAAGTYTQALTIDVGNLTLKATDGANTTIIDGDGASNTIKITADGVTVDGFTITGASSSGVLLDSVSNCQIISNTIKENKIGIHLDRTGGFSSDESCKYNIIEENIIEQNTGRGILFGQEGTFIKHKTIGNQVLNNVISENGNIGIEIKNEISLDNKIEENIISSHKNYGIYIKQGAQNNIIKGNAIDDNNRGNFTGFGTFRGDGIYLSSTSYANFDASKATFGNLIEDNTITKHWNGINLYGDTYSGKNDFWLYENTIKDNTIAENTNDGIAVVASVNNRIEGNDIYDNSRYGVAFEKTYAKWHGSSNNIVINNKIFDNASQEGYYGYYGVYACPDSTDNVAIYNWWGSINGPGKDGANGVSDNVTYNPWYINEEMDTLKLEYPAEGEITNIDPDTVTFKNDKFTISIYVTEFTFKDGDTEMKAISTDGEWTIEGI